MEALADVLFAGLAFLVIRDIPEENTNGIAVIDCLVTGEEFSWFAEVEPGSIDRALASEEAYSIKLRHVKGS